VTLKVTLLAYHVWHIFQRGKSGINIKVTLFRCRACRGDFTITSGTLFAFHKLPLRGYLAAIAIFCNEVKGKSALAISRDLCVSYKAAFVLLHKLREAMAEEMKGRKLDGSKNLAKFEHFLIPSGWADGR
jgi:hypothetical protein